MSVRGRFIGIKQYFRGRNSDRKGAKSHAVRRVRQTSKSGLAGVWGGPNERIGKSQRDIPIHCSSTVSRIRDTPHPPGKVHPSGLAYVI